VVRSNALIGDFLKAKRRQLRRADLGLLPVAGRICGLRREEVAYLAGVSVTWYTWLEQGRAIKPSRQVLTALAQTLRLSGPERAYLLSLGGYSTPRSLTEPASGGVPGQVRRLLDSLSNCPAYVIAPHWQILAWNAAYASLYPNVATVRESERNLLWLLFTDPYLRDLLPDWELTVRSNVAAFRAQAGSRLADPPFSALVDRLLEASELFREVWESHSIEVLSSRERLFHHPVAGDVRLEQHNLTPSDHPGLHVVIYTPTSAVEGLSRPLCSVRSQG
jgi:transcriptional regulator with XRE-family HTH domain